jgi:hypothetical protein
MKFDELFFNPFISSNLGLFATCDLFTLRVLRLKEIF